jgi:4-hydroxy-3-methylbut-2-en-1-yl diphosphate synthase IspG/GcpE
VKYLLPILVLLAVGCKTERETVTEEIETLSFPPIVVDTPVGQFTVQPAKMVRKRKMLETEQAKAGIDMEQVATVAAPLSNALLATGVGGVATSVGLFLWQRYKDQKSQAAIKAACNHADRMEEAETDEEVVAAKERSAREQERLGVHTIIEKARA